MKNDKNVLLRGDDSRPLTTRFSKDEYKWLMTEATANGVSPSMVLRRYVQAMHKTRVAGKPYSLVMLLEDNRGLLKEVLGNLEKVVVDTGIENAKVEKTTDIPL